jgi:tripartite-type tricarboxylate transporter receptor subunit TctC
MKMQGKDFSHPLEMTMPVISNPSAVLRINSLRDLSPLLFQRRTRSSRSSELSSSQTLRFLRHLGGEQSNLVVTHFSHESLKNQKNRRQAFAALSFLSLLFFASAGLAQAPFYQGKTITIIRGSAPGGVGEMRTRAVANYLKKHVPGNPTVVIEFMPGAGGIKAANHLYRGARTDGLVIGSAPSGMVSSAILGESGVQYDLDKFIYLGSPNSESHYVFFTNRKLGLGSMEKLRAHSGLRIGAQTVGHPIYHTGRLFALILGLKDPKFVVGYSSPELDVAMLSGELDATPGVASSVVKQNPEFLEKGLVDFHSIIEIPRGDKHPRFAQLPELDSFVKSDRERKALALHRTFRLAGSPFVLPPGTQKDRADILREAMRKIYTDKEFLAEYQKMTGEQASPLLPDAHEKAIRELPRDPEVIEFYKLLGGTQALPAR